MSGRLEQGNRSDGIHVAEFRRSYFPNGRYAGTVKTSGSASGTVRRQVQL